MTVNVVEWRFESETVTVPWVPTEGAVPDAMYFATNPPEVAMLNSAVEAKSTGAPVQLKTIHGLVELTTALKVAVLALTATVVDTVDPLQIAEDGLMVITELTTTEY